MSTQDEEKTTELTLDTEQLAEISLYMYEKWQEAMKPPLFAYYDFPTWLKRLHSTNKSLEEK